MQKKSEQILDLLMGGVTLKQARLKALKITKEIQGFGNSMASPSSSSSSSSGSSSRTSFGSYSTATTAGFNDIEHELNSNTKETLGSYGLGGIYGDEKPTTLRQTNDNLKALHLWDSHSGQETGSLLDSEGDEDAGKDDFISGICFKLVGISPFRSNIKKTTLRNYSDVGRATKKTFHRQFSAH